jgi:hypothetical protein
MIRGLAILGVCLLASAYAVELSDAEAMGLGRKIWKIECGGTIEGLTSWNKGEEFASLGIGHFIWYPEIYRGPFEQSFPKVLRFLKEHDAKIPAWLLEVKDCPWNTREEFMAAFDSPRMRELRAFLKATIPLQARFAADRLEHALAKMLQTLPEAERRHVRKQFDQLAQHPQGVYVLMDYVNFKGEGTHPSERYNGQGWGLLQVLQTMKGDKSGLPACKEFADTAYSLLERRVRNSPPARNEARWLPGWKNRLKTYAEF